MIDGGGTKSGKFQAGRLACAGLPVFSGIS